MMNKTLLVLLIAPSLLFTWERASANETKESIAASGDQSKGQDRKSRAGSDDSKESPKEQTKRPERKAERQQPQKRDVEQKRDSGDQSRQSRRSRVGGDDSKGSRGEPAQRADRKSQRQQPQKRDVEQKRDTTDQIKRIRETENKDKESQVRKSLERERDRSQKRDIEQKRDSTTQKRDRESERRDAIRTLPDGFRDGGKDRRDDRRERISKENLREKENRWQSRSKEWRKNFSNYRTRNHIFDDHFWDNFRRRYNHWYFDNNFQWYSRATWPRIVVWLPWQWSQPIYYYYETDGDVYYTTTEDFSYLTPVDSKELFIAQAVRIANGQYPVSTQQSDWMPLGMFTFASDDDSSDMPKRYISLAISKDGAVSGAYYDTANNTTLEIQGGIDPDSQRIAWKFVDNDWPIMESGLYNLTKEESTLLIHTSSRTTETQWLIRLEN